MLSVHQSIYCTGLLNDLITRYVLSHCLVPEHAERADENPFILWPCLVPEHAECAEESIHRTAKGILLSIPSFLTQDNVKCKDKTCHKTQ